MASKEWTALRDTYQACAPKTVAGIMARVRATHPDLDLAGLEGTAGLAAEPADVTYQEVVAGGPAALWARPAAGSTDRVIIYFHGGGFVSGSKDSHRKVGGHLATAAGCAVLITDYRLAPLHPYPAQLDDARACYDWLLEQGVQPGRIGLAGDSAGGNLATTAALSLRDDHRPLPGAIAAFSPWYDLEGHGESYESNAGSDLAISRELVHGFGPLYLGGRPPTEPLANPLYADLSGLPPILLTYGSHETLKDSIDLFAARARQSGVEVELRVGEEMQHAYQLMAGRLPEADAAIAEAGAWLRRKLGG